MDRSTSAPELPAEIAIERLEAAAFAPFGDVIELADEPSVMINRGLCGRHDDLAALDFVEGGAAGISLFDATPYAVPHVLDLVERHPLGSQAFLPMSTEPFLVICCEDEGGVPVRPRAWLTDGRQGVNYARGTWHGVLTPIRTSFRNREGTKVLFAVVDRIGGTGSNLEEHSFASPIRIVDARGLIPET